MDREIIRSSVELLGVDFDEHIRLVIDALKPHAEELGIGLHNGPFRFELGGRRFVVSHQPLSPPPDCDFYLHGHTHKLRHEGSRPIIVNPGEACGWLFGRSTVAMLDTETADVEFFDL